EFATAYPVKKPDSTDITQAPFCAHLEVLQVFEAAAGRSMDGGALYEYLIENRANHPYDNVPGISAADYAALDDCAKRFITWFQRTFSEPQSGEDAWEPSRFEYQFAASAPLPNDAEKVYVADEYYQGQLDWYSVDVDAATAALGNVPGSATTGLPPDKPRTMIPAPVSFSGMPNTRWWTFDDRATNFGGLDAGT